MGFSGAATMPWADKVQRIVEAWDPGTRGGQALAKILSGTVNPCAKLAITFLSGNADLRYPNSVAPRRVSEPNSSLTRRGRSECDLTGSVGLVFLYLNRSR